MGERTVKFVYPNTDRIGSTVQPGKLLKQAELVDARARMRIPVRLNVLAN